MFAAFLVFHVTHVCRADSAPEAAFDLGLAPLHSKSGQDSEGSDLFRHPTLGRTFVSKVGLGMFGVGLEGPVIPSEEVRLEP